MYTVQWTQDCEWHLSFATVSLADCNRWVQVADQQRYRLECCWGLPRLSQQTTLTIAVVWCFFNRALTSLFSFMYVYFSLENCTVLINIAELSNMTWYFHDYSTFLPARHYASACNSDRNVSVRPSVCPLCAGIVSKRRKLASWFLHYLVDPWF